MSAFADIIGLDANLIVLLSYLAEIYCRGHFHDLDHDSQQKKVSKVFVSQILRHYLTNEGYVRKLLYYLIWIKEPRVRKFEVLTRSKSFVISQTEKIEVGDHLMKRMEVSAIKHRF